jgi:hypothetical protein
MANPCCYPMLRATLCALLVVAATPLGAQEQKQPQAPRPVQTDVALALVLAVDASGSVVNDLKRGATGILL